MLLRGALIPHMRSFPHVSRNAPDAAGGMGPNNEPQVQQRGSTAMKNSGLQNQTSWQSAPIHAATATSRSIPYMEHRWGMRRPCRARVCVSAGSGVAGTGRLRNISTSGAFLETALPLPVFSQLAVRLLRDDGSTHVVEFTATVIRAEPGGVGLEWCETAGGSICSRLGCNLECAATSGCS